MERRAAHWALASEAELAAEIEGYLTETDCLEPLKGTCLRPTGTRTRAILRGGSGPGLPLAFGQRDARVAGQGFSCARRAASFFWRWTSEKEAVNGRQERRQDA